MKLRVGRELAVKFLRNACRVRLSNQPRLEPLVVAYFVTFRCNLDCSYCGYQRRKFLAKYRDASTDEAKRILEVCRDYVPSIGFSGGEPLVREDIVEIVRYTKSLGFKPVSLFTNSLLLPQREAVLDEIDYLQISLDTTDEAKQDRMSGMPGMGAAVKANIQRYARLQQARDFQINVNCVLGEQNIDDVPGLLDFATANNVRLTICPELDERGQPVPELTASPFTDKYQSVIDFLLREKRRGSAVMDTRPFFEHLRTFRSYECYPALSARVYPDGSLISPCPNLSKGGMNVLTAGSLRELMATVQVDGRHCPQPCFLPCYLETSLLVRHPFALLG
jgi:MoaA/NifB/PqqE/SkfB family radical SAM enzyme